MEVTFEVIGDPKGKGRPRFARNGKFTRAYTPSETVKYERHVAKSYADQVGRVMLSGEIEMDIEAYFPVAKSISKRQRALMLSGEMMHTKKPDIDNICKSIMDGISGVAFEDDKQVCVLHAEKYYGEEPKVIVTLKELEN